MHLDDEHICNLLRQGNPRGMELLYGKYYRPMVVWANTFLDDLHAAEDLVQEFLVVFWERESYKKIVLSGLKSYLFAAVKYAALKHLEKRDPLRRPVEVGNIIVEMIDLDDLTEEMLRQIEAEIEKLPPRTREVLKAVYVDGLRYQEVAEKLSISVATVKTLLVSALRKLRDFFSNFRAFF